jgi:acetyl esterase/lipase
MSFRLEEWVSNAWQTIGTYNTVKTPDSVYVIPLPRSSETKLRIANNTGSGLYVYKIVTRTLQETLDLTLRSSSPAESEICFSNLKRTITLTFNKNVQKGSGTILLNGVSIPLDSCKFSGTLVTIPVTLTTTSTSNKNYSFNISAGAFCEAGNASNLSKTISINFQTIKSVAYPANYNRLIDVVYKNVNSTNCRMDIYYPTDATTPVPVVINMHGGGWVSGFKEEQGGFNMYFNQGYAVANVEYRMRNEILAPAAVEDVRSAMHYILNHADELNINRNKIIFQGGSAGGHLALTGGYLQNNRIYDNDCQQYAGTIKIMAVIDKYGAADLMTFAPVYSGMVAWLGPRATNTDFIKSLSPYEMIDANTPPTYIIHGDADPTIPYTQSVELQAKLQSIGVKNKFLTVPGGGHGGFTDAYNTQMETEVIAFLSEVDNLQTSTSHLTNNSQLKINLTGNTINIMSIEAISASIYDCVGKMLLMTREKSFKINLPGLYIVKVKTSQSTSTIKLIIK